jgi:hypothetical protein
MQNYIFLFFIIFPYLKLNICQSQNTDVTIVAKDTNNITESTNNIEFECELNLECPSTFCCKDSKCVEFSFCKYDNFTVYITVGLTALGIIGIAVTSYIISRKKTMKKMKRLWEKGIIKDEVITELDYLKLIQSKRENSIDNNKSLEEVKENNESQSESQIENDNNNQGNSQIDIENKNK